MSTSTSPASSVPAATPRPSASLVLINSRNEVLFVHRNPVARSFAGVHVFPGGNLDAKQDASLAECAIRETFEESGILLASGPTPPDDVLDTARNAIHAGQTPFRDFLSQHGLAADVRALLPFTQWITPAFAPRRFHTRFFIAFLGSASASGFSSGAREDRIPKPDGGQEVIAARFVHPDAVLAEFAAGTITLMPPQFYIVSTLASILRGGATTAEQRARVEKLAVGGFGSMVINPRPLGKAEEGRVTLTYEGDQTRGGPEGRLHRAHVRSTKGGITTEIKLERNFDIFTEIDLVASKL
ncbi:NUDIX hydrolase domain-like protein [Mycena metata]|uniref:NUDIX hydrolase domain-like protein n=1 Tax=Mycena metata TaxID=1033252 RepID=A0AAD7JKF6_9AGAR|nr:NUDIX hydrolase domain-like protein [Mycena metata]